MKMKGRERWRVILMLLRFIREANDEQLLKVAEFAAREMASSVTGA